MSWRRLSARMLLVHPVRELGKAIPALVGLVLVGRAMGDGQQWWLAPLGVVVVIAVRVLRWLRPPDTGSLLSRFTRAPVCGSARPSLLQRIGSAPFT